MKLLLFISIILLILLVIAFLWLFKKFKRERKEREKQTKENRMLKTNRSIMEAEYLKFQIQPHTLNNILANLRSISSKLSDGMDSLAETLEYVLYKGNTQFVSVKDEINFIQKYLTLYDLLINEIDSIKVDLSEVDENSSHYFVACIPHLITGYFIENAFKHGDINHPEFLYIQIKLDDKKFEMSVTNKIKERKISSNGGIGIANMNKRLSLLLEDRYEIDQNINDDEYQAILIIRF
jgi:two-component system LytT family sensor kinase